MKQILGRKIREKRAITTDGQEIGRVLDAYFENNGRVDSIIVKPESMPRGAKEYTNQEGKLTIPFQHVKAVGEYVVIDFPME